MGDFALDRQPQARFRPLVAFDFDGTLTCRDSFRAFVAWRAGPVRYAAGLVRLIPQAAGYVASPDRGRLKASFVREFLKGAAHTELAAQAQAFAAAAAPDLLRTDALRAWRRWQAQGARLVIVTASPELIVAPFARGLGADALLGTELAFDADDRLTGELAGPNCRGPEKVRRLRQAFGEDVVLEAAYGDSDGDRQMLAMAEEQGMRVFRGRGKGGR